MMGPYREMGKRLDVLLDTENLSAAELCRRIDIAPNTFSQWRNGKHKISAKGIDALRREFGLTSDWLLYGDPRNLPYEFRTKMNELIKIRGRNPD